MTTPKQRSVAAREFTRALITSEGRIPQLLLVTVEDGVAYWQIWRRLKGNDLGKLETSGMTTPDKIDVIVKNSAWTERKA